MISSLKLAIFDVGRGAQVKDLNGNKCSMTKDKLYTNTTLSPILSEMPDAMAGYCPDDRHVVGPKRPCADDELSGGCAR
jgi:hypothetical protein